jgi:Zn-dependent protease
MNFSNIDWMYVAIAFVVVVISVGLHEYGHAKFADLAGDLTPRMQGRVTLNPLAHLDPLGTVMFLVTIVGNVGIGWGKPVMVRPDKMKNPRWDHFISVLAGPMMNLLLACIFALAFRLMAPSADDIFAAINHRATNPAVTFVFLGVLLNIGMMVFNLIPLGPLDGHWLVGAFLPENLRFRWYRFNRTYGSIILLALILLPEQFDVLSKAIAPVIVGLAKFFFGIK